MLLPTHFYNYHYYALSIFYGDGKHLACAKCCILPGGPDIQICKINI